MWWLVARGGRLGLGLGRQGLGEGCGGMGLVGRWLVVGGRGVGLVRLGLEERCGSVGGWLVRGWLAGGGWVVAWEGEEAGSGVDEGGVRKEGLRL